jgi:hypothetical protein
MSGQKRHIVCGETHSSAAALRLGLPAAQTDRTGSGQPPDAHTQAVSQVSNHVAQTLHETVMQTLVATTYLAENPTTSRLDLIRYLRQATHELRCVIDRFAGPEAGIERLRPTELRPTELTLAQVSTGDRA